MSKKVTHSKAKKLVDMSTKEYAQVLIALKTHVRQAQVKAVFSANRELLKLYWFIGKIMVEKQAEYGWGSHTIEKLAQDLQHEFPGLGGFSRANVFRMQAFYKSYEKVAQPARQLDELPSDELIGQWVLQNMK